jgi:urease accessory protein
LRIDLAAGARLLMVEPLIFGRAARGESVTRLAFRDRIEITRDGQPLYTDAIGFRGDMDAHLMRRGVAGGARAMASLVHVAPDAEAHLDPLRATLPQGAGVSLLAADMLALRVVAADGFALRAALLPVLDRLSHNTLPVSWRL